MADACSQPVYSGDVVPELPGYRIERQLGRGSSGVVYLAEDTQLRRKVALKILAPTLADDELFRKRFDRESQSAANLDHPNIVPVYAAGEAGGFLYIAMRYVGGGDLRALLETQGQLSLEQAVSIVASVADALDAAHAQGMIHRDVKPANILIDSRNGQQHYYLSDFGIAKIISSGRSLTSAGQIVGTIDYIAPEQINGKAVDGRADLYALGCVLYQCLTGVVPFPRDETAALMWAHVHDEVSPVITTRPDLPPQLDYIVAKSMAKQPEDRYDTCRDLALALRSLAADPVPAGDSASAVPASSLDSPPPSAGMTSTYTPPIPTAGRAPATSSPPRKKWWWFAAGVLILALIGGSTAGAMKYFSSRYPNAAERELLAREVPLALAQTKCGRNGEAERDTANVQASVMCTSAGDAANTVAFTEFKSSQALDSRYQQAVTSAGIGQGSGSCLNAAVQGGYANESGRTGRALCYRQLGSSFIAWTDDKFHTLGLATRVDSDYVKLQDWWADVVGLPTITETQDQAQARKQVEEAQKQTDEARKQAADVQQQAEAARKQQADEAARQLAEVQKQADDAQKQQAADAKRQTDETNKQVEEAQKQATDAEKKAEEAQKQAQDAQKQAIPQPQGRASQGSSGGQQDVQQPPQDSTSQGSSGGQQDVQQPPQDSTSQGSSGGQQDVQQPPQNSAQPDSAQPDSAPQASAGEQDVQQLMADSMKLAIRQHGAAGAQSLRQRIDDAITRAAQQHSTASGQNVRQRIDDAIKQALEQAQQGQR
jgi:serine/threonine protein kinase